MVENKKFETSEKKKEPNWAGKQYRSRDEKGEAEFT